MNKGVKINERCNRPRKKLIKLTMIHDKKTDKFSVDYYISFPLLL